MINNTATTPNTTNCSNSLQQKLSSSRIVSLRTIQISHYLFIVFILLLSACQNQAVFQSYKGEPKPDNDIASIIVPENFDLLFIDGKSYSQSFIIDGVTIKTLPGNHNIVVKYLDYWDINADNHERIESQPVMISFSVAAGKRYRITTKPLKTIAEARLFAQSPSLNIVDLTNNEQVAAEIKYQLDDQKMLASFNQNPATPAPTIGETDTRTSAQPAMQSSQSSAPALEMLKYWWQQADPQQRQNFLQWIK